MKYICLPSFVLYYYDERGLPNNFPETEYQDHLQESVDSGLFLVLSLVFFFLIPSSSFLLVQRYTPLTITGNNNSIKVSRVLFQFTKLHLNFQLWINYYYYYYHSRQENIKKLKTFFVWENKVFSTQEEVEEEEEEESRKIFFKLAEPWIKRGKGEEKWIRNYFAERFAIHVSFHLSTYFTLSLIERENGERSVSILHSSFPSNAPDNGAGRCAFTLVAELAGVKFQRKLIWNFDAGQTRPRLGKTTFVPNTSLPSAHLGKLLLAEEGLKGERWIPSSPNCIGYFKTRCFRGGEERIREEATKAKGLGTPPRYAVLIPPARKIDEPPDFLSTAQRHLLPIAQLFPPTSPSLLFAVTLDVHSFHSGL